MNCPICGAPDHEGQCVIQASGADSIGFIASVLPPKYLQQLQDLFPDD